MSILSGKHVSVTYLYSIGLPIGRLRPDHEETLLFQVGQTPQVDPDRTVEPPLVGLEAVTG